VGLHRKGHCSATSGSVRISSPGCAITYTKVGHLDMDGVHTMKRKYQRRATKVNTSTDPTRAVWTKARGLATRIKGRIGQGYTFERVWEGLPHSAKEGITKDEVCALLIKDGVIVDK
jgi:hypothetical protein